MFADSRIFFVFLLAISPIPKPKAATAQKKKYRQAIDLGAAAQYASNSASHSPVPSTKASHTSGGTGDLLGANIAAQPVANTLQSLAQTAPASGLFDPRGGGM